MDSDLHVLTSLEGCERVKATEFRGRASGLAHRAIHISLKAIFVRRLVIGPALNDTPSALGEWRVQMHVCIYALAGQRSQFRRLKYLCYLQTVIIDVYNSG